MRFKTSENESKFACDNGGFLQRERVTNDSLKHVTAIVGVAYLNTMINYNYCIPSLMQIIQQAVTAELLCAICA